MQIKLNHIIPKPMAEKLKASDIWNVEITFQPHEHYAVLAPSGRGKSTFAHIIYGIRNDFNGTVHWEGTNISDYNWTAIQKIRSTSFGIIFQDLRLFQDLSAKDNIAIYQEDGSVPNWDRILHWAERLDISAHLEKKTALLSYGQQQRVAIIRALSRPFKWLIMDEPFSHLDNKNKLSASQLILEISKEYKAGTIITALDQVPEMFAEHQRLIL